MAEHSAEHFTRFTTIYCLKKWQQDNSMDKICYLECICRPEQPFIFFKTAIIEVKLTSNYFEWIELQSDRMNSAFVGYEKLGRSRRVGSLM